MARGGYTFDQIKKMSSLELQFIDHYQELIKKEQQEFLVSTLGVIWDKSSLISKSSEQDKPIEKLFIPLAVAMNPDILSYIKKQFNITENSIKDTGVRYIGGGEYMPNANETIKSMSELPKEEFLRMLGRR